MARYRKRPVVVEAFCLGTDPMPDWFMPLTRSPNAWHIGGPGLDHVLIETLEGTMQAELGYWIIQGVQGEIYPCKPDIFVATHTRVED